MSTATNEVLDVAAKLNIDLRTAAYVLALNKINDFYDIRGVDIWYVLYDSHNYLQYQIKFLK